MLPGYEKTSRSDTEEAGREVFEIVEVVCFAGSARVVVCFQKNSGGAPA
ncbi:hypothetical protein RRSWK_04518 [Rhodopirellula sp. SWK7]|nr:hypothetical protein RRSWK_04518 [Rhodopirellula sp. SWK7]